MAVYTNPTKLRYIRSRTANTPSTWEILATAMHDPSTWEILATAMHDPIGTCAFTDTEAGRDPPAAGRP